MVTDGIVGNHYQGLHQRWTVSLLSLLLQLSLFGFSEETCVTQLSTAGKCWRITRCPSWRTWLHSTWKCSKDCITMTVLTRCGHGMVMCEQCSEMKKRYKYNHSSRLRICFSLFCWPVCFFWHGVNKQTYKPNINLARAVDFGSLRMLSVIINIVPNL